MRKRTIKYCFDTILWGILTLLPLILYILAFFFMFMPHVANSGVSGFITSQFVSGNLDFITVMRHFYCWFDLGGSSPFEDNIIYNALQYIFNNADYGFMIDASDTSFICWFASWIINVQLLHIVVDFILILPRICRKFLDKFKSEDC